MCPKCIAAAVRFHVGERVDQFEMFEYVDSTSSMSALGRGRGELTHISKVLSSAFGADDLPF